MAGLGVMPVFHRDWLQEVPRMGQGVVGRAEDSVLHCDAGILRSLPGSFGSKWGRGSLLHFAHSPNQVRLDRSAVSLCVMLASTHMCLGWGKGRREERRRYLKTYLCKRHE